MEKPPLFSYLLEARTGTGPQRSHYPNQNLSHPTTATTSRIGCGFLQETIPCRDDHPCWQDDFDVLWRIGSDCTGRDSIVSVGGQSRTADSTSIFVQETQTLTEDDFWKTHQHLLEEEYARISGMTRAGTSTLLQSHLQLLTGRVTLGVEEMRQIFILYPAVHKTNEENIPLELSDEQFWRKYLESEYFHRDRGRLGAASRSSSSPNQKRARGLRWNNKRHG